MRSDNRGKKIALLAHCILNQNAKVYELAQFPGVVPNICCLLEKYDYAVVQLPCPEIYAAGLNRWGQVKEQYENTPMQRAFMKAAKFTWDNILDYIKAGYKVVLIGIDGSPSCGVDITESAPGWGGTSINANPDPVSYVKGYGAFIQIIMKFAKDINLNLPAIGIPMDVQNQQIDLEVIEDFLQKNK